MSACVTADAAPSTYTGLRVPVASRRSARVITIAAAPSVTRQQSRTPERVGHHARVDDVVDARASSRSDRLGVELRPARAPRPRLRRAGASSCRTDACGAPLRAHTRRSGAAACTAPRRPTSGSCSAACPRRSPGCCHRRSARRRTGPRRARARRATRCSRNAEPPVRLLSVSFGWMPRYSAKVRPASVSCGWAMNSASTSRGLRPASAEREQARACAARSIAS